MVYVKRTPHIQARYASTSMESEYPGLWQGLVSAYPFGMMTPGSSLIFEFNRRSSDATLQGSASLSAGGANLNFASLDHVALTDNLTSYFSTAATVCMRLALRNNTPATGDPTGLMHLQTHTQASHYPWTDDVLYLSTFRTARVTFGNNAAFNKTVKHLLTIRTDANIGYQLLQNNTVFGSTTAQGTVSIGTSAQTLGRSFTSPDTFHYVDGVIYEVLLYNRYLSDMEVAILTDVDFAPFTKRRKIFSVSQAVSSGRANLIMQYSRF